jgi:hypothetical protein
MEVSVIIGSLVRRRPRLMLGIGEGRVGDGF